MSRTLPGTAPNASGSQVALKYTSVYDADNNRTAMTDPMGDTWTMSFDTLNRPTATTDPLNHTISVGYDPVGNPTSYTDGLGHVTTDSFDERNRRVSETLPSGGGTMTWAYDAHARVTSLTGTDGSVTTWGYDNADRPTTETDPRGKQTANQYDLVGNVTQETDRDGRVRQFGSDADNRPTTETWVAAGAKTGTGTLDGSACSSPGANHRTPHRRETGRTPRPLLRGNAARTSGRFRPDHRSSASAQAGRPTGSRLGRSRPVLCDRGPGPRPGLAPDQQGVTAHRMGPRGLAAAHVLNDGSGAGRPKRSRWTTCRADNSERFCEPVDFPRSFSNPQVIRFVPNRIDVPFGANAPVNRSFK